MRCRSLLIASIAGIALAGSLAPVAAARVGSGQLTLGRALHRLHIRVVIGWKWRGSHTALTHFEIRGLHDNGRVELSCAGPHCPFERIGSNHSFTFDQRRDRELAPIFTAGDRITVMLEFQVGSHIRRVRERLLVRPNGIPRVLTPSRSG